MSTELEDAVRTLLKDVKDLRGDMKDVIAGVKARVRSRVEDAGDSLRESAAQRVEQVREAAHSVGDKCCDAWKSCAAEIEKHPLASVLIALGAGAILGGLMRSHRR